MKTKLITVISISLIGILFVIPTETIKAETIIYVPDDYSTIQAAVDAASPGDTIIVRDGTYIENINVNKDHLTIKSENGAEKTIVQAANSSDHVFEIKADYVNINGFTIKDVGEGIEEDYRYFKAGVYLDGADHCIISNNNAYNNSYGFFLYNSSSNTLINNLASRNRYVGIVLHYLSNYNVLTNNDASDNWEGIGVYSSSNILTNNAANNNIGPGEICYAQGKESYFSICVRPVGIYLRGYLEFTSDLYPDAECINNTLTENIVNKNGYNGIQLVDSHYNTLTRNLVKNNNNIGLWLRRSDYNKIYLHNFSEVPSREDSTNTWNPPEPITYTYKGKTYTNYLGNYWSDYTGSDADGDGIGDTPYSIDFDKDNYPLMKPFEDYIVAWRTIERVSVASDGTEGNQPVGWISEVPAAINGDGRFVAFESGASNLVPGDTNGAADVFVRNRLTGETTRVSVASDGAEGNAHSGAPGISADGRFIAFCSFATNLVTGDTNGAEDIFIHDRLTSQITLVSVASDGTQGNGDSGWFDDGRAPAGTPGYKLVSAPSLSADGRFVAFESWASNLVPGDTNGSADVFVHDRLTGETKRVSIASDSTQGNCHSFRPSLSADGRFMVFESCSSNLVSGDANGGALDVFVHDRLTGETTLVSVASDGSQGGAWSGNTGSITPDGRLVSFHSWNSLGFPQTKWEPDTFVHDRKTGLTERVSVASNGTEGNDWSVGGGMSADGRFVIFGSEASNLVSGDTNGAADAFVHDRLTGETSRVSVASDGFQGNGASRPSGISSDGRFIVFVSSASNLVPDDTNGLDDIFVFSFKPVPVCSDGTKNQDETDIDCGGSCLPCENGKSCNVSSDCQSGFCNQGVCASPPENQPPNKPVNKSPKNNATTSNVGGMFEASPYSDPEGDPLKQIHLQITKAVGDYSSPIFDKKGALFDAPIINEFWMDSSYGKEVVLFFYPGILDYDTTYYWHIRYQDDKGNWSDWSDETTFKTAMPSFSYSPIDPYTNENIIFEAHDVFWNVSSSQLRDICKWNFGENDKVIEEGCRLSHFYSQAGKYGVSLIVVDEKGKEHKVSKELKIQEDQLIATFASSNSSPKIYEEIILDASGSHNLNPRRKIVSYKWDLDGNGDFEGSTTNSKIFYFWTKPRHFWEESPRRYKVMLKIEDDIEKEATCIQEIPVSYSLLHPSQEIEINKERLNTIISELDLKICEQQDCDFNSIYSLAAVLGKPVANEKIILGEIKDKKAKEALERYTYEAKISSESGEMKMVDSILTWQSNTDLSLEISQWIPLLSIAQTMKTIADILIDAGLEGLEEVGRIIKGVKDVNKFWGCWNGLEWVTDKLPSLKFWQKAVYYNTLRTYLYERGERKVHEEAWRKILLEKDGGECIGTDRCLSILPASEIEPTYKALGDTYGRYISGGDLKEDFKQGVKTTLKEFILSVYQQYRFELPYLEVKIKSPGELRVYDSHGRVTGLVNEEIKEEIPNSIYDEENKAVIIFDPFDTYRYEVVGTDEGTYGLTVTAVENGEATTFTATDIPTTPGQIHQYTIDWDALSQGEEGVTLQIDLEGDGMVDQTVIAGNTLHIEKTDLVYQGDTAGYFVDEINLKAKLTNEKGEGIAGKNIIFSLFGQLVSAMTDFQGIATATFTINAIPEELTETYQIEISFPGNEEYLASQTQSDFTLKSAKWLKQEAISELVAAKNDDKKINQKIDRIVRFVNQSLDDNFWIDASHLGYFKRDCGDFQTSGSDLDKMNLEEVFELEPEKAESKMEKALAGECLSTKFGLSVFYKEYLATKLMLNELRGKTRIPTGLKTIFQQVITKLVKADQLLAEIAIDDAKNTPIKDPKFQKMVERQIERAEREFQQAERRLARDGPDRAILRFARSWLHSQLAIKYAQRD